MISVRDLIKQSVLNPEVKTQSSWHASCYRILVRGKKGVHDRYSINPLLCILLSLGLLELISIPSLIKVSKVSLHFLTILRL